MGRAGTVLVPFYTPGVQGSFYLRGNSCWSYRVISGWRALGILSISTQLTSGDSMASSGMDQQRLADLQNVIRADIKAGLYHGAVIKAARAGVVALEAAIGAMDASQTRPLALTSVFSIFSISTAFTNTLVLRAVGLGRLALTSQVTELIPEFS